MVPSTMQRLAGSPAEARTMSKAMVDLDVREVLPRIRVPTLVMHRNRDQAWDIRHSRYLAEHIGGARFVELEGRDSFPFVGDRDAIVEEIEEFLTGGGRGGEIARGECELIGDDVAGMAVHIASRVNGLAAAGEILVSGTVYGTVVGGPFRFEERGLHELKGVPGPWPLFALSA
jgi:hypothetical protein